MRVLVSGQAGAYAVQSGTQAEVFNVLDARSYSSEARNLPYLFAPYNDLHYVEVSGHAQAAQLVTKEWSINRAVRYFIILLEPRETASERREVAEELASYLKDGDVTDGVERQLFGQTLPQSRVPDLRAAVLGVKPVEGLVDELLDHQTSIGRIRAAYDQLSETFFAAPWTKAAVLEHAIDNGWFRSAAKAIAKGDDLSFLSLTMQATRQIEGIRDIVTAWLQEFLPVGRPKKHVQNDVDEDFHDEELFDGPGGFQAKQMALSQFPAIIDRLRKGDLVGAETFAQQLIRSQSSPKYAAMSLCRLSKTAEMLQIFPLQLKWADKAVAVFPEDPKTFGHLADALIQQNRFVEAVAALDEAELRGERQFATTGRARVLRAQGRLVEARKGYLQAYEIGPDTSDAVHALAGAAGTLREMGRLEDSLDEYMAALKLFPDATILLSGQAATLAALGRFTEAMKIYSALEGRQNEAISARNGKAAILKASGRLADAVREYRRIHADNPFDAQSANGLADALRLEGRLDEALKLYRENEVRFPFTPQSLVGQADVYRDKGKHESAVEVLTRAASVFPGDITVRAELASYAGSKTATELLAQLDQLLAEHPQLFLAKVQRAELLRRLGRSEAAIAAYDAILSSRPGYLPAINGKASVLLLVGSVEQALAMLPAGRPSSHDEWRSYMLRAMALARSGAKPKAIKHLKSGISTAPFDRQVRLMRAALASIQLSDFRPAAAVKVVGDMRADIAGVVRLHALAFERRIAQARQAYAVAKDVPEGLANLRDEIARRYGVIPGKSIHDVKWIIQQEQNGLIFYAAG